MRTSPADYTNTLAWPDEWYDRIRSWELFNEADGTLSKSTLALYKGKLEGEFLPWILSTGWTAPIENLTAEHLREFMLYLLRSKGLSGGSRLISRSAVRSLWRFMRLDDYVDADPFEQRGVGFATTGSPFTGATVGNLINEGPGCILIATGNEETVNIAGNVESKGGGLIFIAPLLEDVQIDGCDVTPPVFPRAFMGGPIIISGDVCGVLVDPDNTGLVTVKGSIKKKC